MWQSSDCACSVPPSTSSRLPLGLGVCCSGHWGLVGLTVCKAPHTCTLCLSCQYWAHLWALPHQRHKTLGTAYHQCAWVNIGLTYSKGEVSRACSTESTRKLNHRWYSAPGTETYGISHSYCNQLKMYCIWSCELERSMIHSCLH